MIQRWPWLALFVLSALVETVARLAKEFAEDRLRDRDDDDEDDDDKEPRR